MRDAEPGNLLRRRESAGSADRIDQRFEVALEPAGRDEHEHPQGIATRVGERMHGPARDERRRAPASVVRVLTDAQAAVPSIM